MTDNIKKIKESVTKNQENIIQSIIDKYNINEDIWYVDSFKIKDGKWNTAALKRDQDLEWSQETNSEGLPIQIMTGYSKRYPDFILAENKTYSIEITFKRKPIENDILSSFKELVKEMPKYEIIKPKKRIIRNGIAAEMATYDAHLGKLAWEMETGYRNYDLNIAAKDFTYATNKNLDLLTIHKPEKLFYIVGQDLYHMDNMAGHTTGGSHTLDVDGRITKVHKKAFEVTRNNILECSKLCPVEVIWIPGNHDFLSSYMLCFALKEHFKNNKRIYVDIEEMSRKARLWGNLLVGWTHRIVGRQTNWANELAQAFKEEWGKSIFREWHHGDQHKKQTVKVTPVFTSGGVTMRQITALSTIDKWHYENLFTDAIPGGESFLWSKEEGIFGNFMIWTSQYEKIRNNLIK